MLETRKDPGKQPLYKSLYFQVITALILGVILVTSGPRPARR